MKKTLLCTARARAMKAATLAAAIFALAGCNRADTGDYTGFGSMRVSASADPAVISVRTRAANTDRPVTRAANLDTKTYHLVLQSGAAVAFAGTLPTGGTVANLPAGTYTGTLRSDAADFTAPAFDAPFYSATVADIAITPGGTTPVAFTCKQSNAGVRFVYDASLAAAGLGDIIPVIAQGGNSLTYDGANREATGYFVPGGATITLTDDGSPVAVSGGAASVPLTLAARELWTITVKAVAAAGGAGITVEVDTGTDGRDLEITLDPSDGGDGDGGGDTGGDNGGTDPDPSAVVFSEDFAGCTGAAYPVAGAVFDADAAFNSLTTVQ